VTTSIYWIHRERSEIQKKELGTTAILMKSTRNPMSYLPKPKDKKKTRRDCFEITRDGRLIIDISTVKGRDMRDGITAKAWSRQEGLCGICRRYVCLLESVGDHIKPRGMGGATRDDSLENIQAVHPECNSLKGSRRDFQIEIVP
jgi:5-methylcytosine-specific restriction endonuclease McrA